MNGATSLLRVGAVIPSVNRVFERDARMVASRGVEINVARWRTAKSHSEAQRAMTALPDIFRSLADAQPDMIAFACTAGSAYGGRAAEAGILRTIEETCGLKGITTAGALARACTAAAAKRVLFISPFDHAYAAPEADGLSEIGASIQRLSVWGFTTARECDAIEIEEICRRTLAADSDDVDAIVISCANVRGAEAAPKVAAVAGKPVFSSNQALLDELIALKEAQE